MKHFRIFPTHLWEHEIKEKKHLNKRIISYVLEQDTGEKNWQSGSELFKIKEFDVLNKNIPNSKIEIIKGCSHNVHLEIPEKFNEIVKNFLE